MSKWIDVRTVLYPGSWVDVAPSIVWPEVTYVDTDNHAAQLFDDTEGVREIITSQPHAPPDPHVTFMRNDYTSQPSLPPATFDLLVSL